MNKQTMIIGGVIFVIALTFLYPQKDTYSKKNNEQITEMADNNEQSNFSFQNTEEGGTLITTASGLQYEVIKMGNGEKPNATDKVEVHYHGTLEDGTVFDSSVDRGQTISFPLNRVIQGWTEGVQLMPVGSKFKFIIPPELGYGDRGAGAVIPPNATLIFEVELFSIEKPFVDTDFSLPAEEKVLDSGLRYLDHVTGDGDAIEVGQEAIVHYSGYLADGTKFDSSHDRGQPFSFPLGQGRVIKGWDEGVAQLKVGGKATFVIPFHLAYGERGYPPVIPAKATLEFDVELVDVK